MGNLTLMHGVGLGVFDLKPRYPYGWRALEIEADLVKVHDHHGPRLLCLQ